MQQPVFRPLSGDDAIERHGALRLAVVVLVCSLCLGIGAAHAQTSGEEEKAEVSEAGEPSPSEITEETITVTGRASRLATKTETPLLDVPQTINVVPREVIEEQQAQSLTEVVRNVSGMVQSSRTGDNYHLYSMRGFYSDSDGNFRKNGVELSKRGELLNANAERVEVLKGPSSVLYGRLDPGGIINVVTKKPQLARAHSAELRAGDFDRFEGRLDITGPIGRSSRVLYRLNAAVEDTESYRDDVEYRSSFISPVLTWLVDDRTRWTLELEHKDEKGTSDQGLAAATADFDAFDRVPIGTFLGEPDAQFERRHTAVHSTLERQLSGSWLLRNVLNVTRYDRDPRDVTLGQLLEDGRTITRSADFRRQDFHFGLAELNLIGDFETGSVKHRLTLGAEYQRTELDELRFRATVDPIDIFTPVHTGLPQSFDQNGDSEQIVDMGGLYVQDQVSVGDRLHFHLGLRYTAFEQENTNNLSGSVQRFSPEELSPQIGVVYQPKPTVSLYGSYTESFAPTIFIDDEGNPFEPSFGEQTEVGVKVDFLGGKLSANVAVFQLTKTNELSFFRDPVTGIFQVAQGGRHRSEGVEIDVFGRLGARLNVIGSYAYLDARVLEDPAYPAGTPLGGAPEQRVSLWGNYAFENRLELAGGVFYVDRMKSFNSSQLFLPSHLTFDAALAYGFLDRYKLRLNVKNISDERYYLSGGSGRVVFPAPPRRFQLALEVRF